MVLFDILACITSMHVMHICTEYYLVSSPGIKIKVVYKRNNNNNMSHDMTNQQNECAPAKTQISLGIRPDCSESSLCTQWVAKDPSFLHADSEDSDQTGRMPRLI